MHVGKLKVSALRDDLRLLRPGTEVEAHPLDVVADANQIRPLFARTDLVVCAADGVAPRRVVSHLARRAGLDAILACVLEDGGLGEVLRLRPWKDRGCLVCQREALAASGGGRVRRVRVSASAATTIRREAARSRCGNETGGILLGALSCDGTAEVRHAGEAGPVAVRQPTFFLRDLDHPQHIAAEAFTHDGSVWIGEWHTHPTAEPVPSNRDLNAYARLLTDPNLHFDVIISMTVVAASDGWDDPIARAWACYPTRAEAVPPVSEHQPTSTRRQLMEDNQ